MAVWLIVNHKTYDHLAIFLDQRDKDTKHCKKKSDKPGPHNDFGLFPTSF